MLHKTWLEDDNSLNITDKEKTIHIIGKRIQLNDLFSLLSIFFAIYLLEFWVISRIIGGLQQPSRQFSGPLPPRLHT